MEVAPNPSTDYFSSYEDLEVHKLMLNDSPRTGIYKKAIEINADNIKGKTVMDVGCGTGILSIFCAQVGAKKVYAVEASNIAKLAEKIVKENNFEDVIEVIQSRVEDIHLDIKVDVIVSEWMGFYLLHEGMLDSVLYARDKFLKEDGAMYPESAAIYAAPCRLPALYDEWDNCFGVSMKEMALELRKNKSIKPEIMNLNGDDLLSNQECVCWIDLKTVDNVDAFNNQIFSVASKTEKFQGICVCFKVQFPLVGDLPIELDTSPGCPATHWKQTVIVLPEERPVEKGEAVFFDISIARSQQNKRWYDIQVTILDSQVVEHPTPCECDFTKCIIVRKFMESHPEKELNGAGDTESSLLQDEIISDDDD